MKSTLKRILPQSVQDGISRKRIAKRLNLILDSSKEKDSWTSEEAISYLFRKDSELFTPWQHIEEISGLARKVEEQKPTYILEIGTASGGTLLLWSMLANPDAVLISIDLPEGPFGGGYPEWKISIYESIARNNQKVHLIRDNSHSDETFQKVQDILAGKELDFLFIDGDHSYEGAKSDFDRYQTLVKTKGMVAFHDIVSDKDSKPDHFVSVLWDEIKNDYEHFEFVKDWGQSKLGLGLIIK